jgi:diguanylate cyclase (GGDEF)-like protein/PAS domain S-box-containing protein
MYRILSCLTVEHDWRLVILAALICFLASLAAVSLFHRSLSTRGRTRATWIVTAGVVTGCGIWATHFIAMLAYEPGVATAYDVGLTAASLVAAAVVTSTGLGVAACGSSRWHALLGGGIVGGGIACMHYTGMSALELPGRLDWSPPLVAASIALGIVFGAGALLAATRRNDLRAMFGAALLLALAIVSHHFTAMGAVEIMPDPARAFSAMTIEPTALALAIAGVTVTMLALGVAGTVVDERFHDQRARLDAALNNMRHGLLMLDAEGRLLVYNRRYLEMYGLPVQLVNARCDLRELLQMRVAAGTFGHDPDRYISELPQRSKIDAKLMELPDGRTISIRNSPADGGGWVSIHEDVTERLRAEKELEHTKSFLDTVIENVPATLIVKDARDLTYKLINRAGEALFGLPRDQMIGKTSHDVFDTTQADAIAARDREVLQSGEQLLVENVPVQTPHRGTRLVTTKRLAIPDSDGAPRYMLGVIEDVTERRKAEERIAHMAHHDSLTDLPNRSAFNEHMAATLARSAKSGERFAVLCLDLDRFKEINDLFGHAIGDELLRGVSRRLEAAAGDAFLGRLGGDEFMLIQADGPQPASAAALAERLLAAVADDLDVDGNLLRVGLSVGLAIYPSDGHDAAALINNADAALYRAKAQGRGTICFFEAGMDQRLRERRELLQELRTAVPRNELVLHYQPQAKLGDKIIGFEALARWNHPSRGLISAGAFIPVAEESGLILPIGEWILREACREAASWPRPLQVAVNLSPAQFHHGDLPGLVHSVLLETGLSPGRLELEITEGVLIGDFSRATSILRRLKALGVRIAMDDFGTGYSSLSYLHSFPFDKIKIDRAFIANLDSNPQSAAIVRAVIALARGLNLPVIAEGVETESQLAFLSREACSEIQGYLLGKPQPIEEYDDVVGRGVKVSTFRLRLAG